MRLLRAPSSLTSSVFWDGFHYTSRQPIPVPHHTYCKKNSSLYLIQISPSFSLKPFPLILSQQTVLKSLSFSFLQPLFSYWKATIRSPCSSLLFCMLNSPSSFSLSSFLWGQYSVLLFSGIFKMFKSSMLCFWRPTWPSLKKSVFLSWSQLYETTQLHYLSKC